MDEGKEVCDACREKNFKRVTHCIFDLDGTLLDTELLYKQVISDMLRDVFEKELTPEAYRKIIGRNTSDMWKILISDLELRTSVDEILPEYFARCNVPMRNRPLMPGAEALVRHLHKSKVPLAIATSCEKDLIETETQHLKEFFSLFHHVVSGASDPEVRRGKPFPDIYLVCASRFQDEPSPERCIVFEDSPNAASGAINAGMQCVLVTSSETRCQNGMLILNTLADFKPHLFGLPSQKV